MSTTQAEQTQGDSMTLQPTPWVRHRATAQMCGLRGCGRSQAGPASGRRSGCCLLSQVRLWLEFSQHSKGCNSQAKPKSCPPPPPHSEDSETLCGRTYWLRPPLSLWDRDYAYTIAAGISLACSLQSIDVYNHLSISYMQLYTIYARISMYLHDCIPQYESTCVYIQGFQL